MNENEKELKIALSMVKGITAATVRGMEELGVEADAFFSLPMKELSEALGGGDASRFEQLDREEALARARREIQFMKKHSIKASFMLDDDYPRNLREAPDAPIVIYTLGDTDLNADRSIAIVGTRKPTGNGVETCRKITEDLGVYFPDLLVVSGLAYGIDAAAHTAALDNSLATAAVMAHGLDMIYPSAHRELARRIVKNGGCIISEYPSGEKPFRQRFLERNRIVAGLSAATIVVESAIKGGAMSTANIAFSYSREVLAVPGRPSDEQSAGCNSLIKRGKASLAVCAADVMEALNWQPEQMKVDVTQRNLFPELDGNCKIIYDTLRFSKNPMSVDTLHTATSIPVAEIMSLLGEMEFDGIVLKHPGNRYTTT